MYHSITIGKLETVDVIDSGLLRSYTKLVGKNTWDDWKLIPVSRPLVSPPSPNTKSVSIPGMNGSLDLSTLFTGYMTYQNRSGSWTFIVHNEYADYWQTLYTKIMEYLHGKSLVCSLEDDRDYYYEGLFTVNNWQSNRDWSRITISYSLYPYKRLIQATDEPWLWDPFNFETGVIRDYGTITVPGNGSATVRVIGAEEPIMPEIYSSSANVSLTINGKTYSLSSGIKKYSGLRIYSGFSGNAVFTNSGSGSATVGIIYRAGEF